ncbi:MAG: hypothetical protein ACQES2_06550 [Pseudomonadota bacterium]
MGIFSRLDFVRDEIKELPGVDKKPKGGMRQFTGRVRYALALAFKEKEIFFFALMQWVSIGAAYLLWVQMLDWIPEPVWRSAEEADGASVVDLVLMLWSFFCVGLAAYPVGLFTGCMGATHFLHRQGKPSTVAACLRLVLPQSWPLWAFHWIDGWITVDQIFDRLPRKNDTRTPAQRALDEALYYAWKLGVAGVLPGILTGHGLVQSGKRSIAFVKDNLAQVAGLRAGYSALCWVVGILAYVGGILWVAMTGIIPEGAEAHSEIYTVYLWAVVPLMISLAVVMLLLRPVYVLALCDLYSEDLAKKGEDPELPGLPSRGVSALVAFAGLVLILAMVYLYRQELGITALLSTPY